MIVLLLALYVAATTAVPTADNVHQARLDAMATAQAFAAAGNATNGRARVLVVGDSWGTVVAAGSTFGASFFARALKDHKCAADETSIAIPGSTSTDWIEGGSNYKILQAAHHSASITAADSACLQTALLAKPDYVWMIILGNGTFSPHPIPRSSFGSPLD